MRWTLVLALLMAGCVAPGTPDVENAAGEDPAVGPDIIQWIGCSQWHLHFDGRAQDFQPDVPPGFTVSADANGLTTLLIHVTLCGDTKEAVLAVPVLTPAEFADENRSAIAVLQVFHAGIAADLYPEPFAGRLVEATFTTRALPTGDTLTIVGGGETTTLALALVPSSGAFGAERWARFAGDTTTIGKLNADGNESTSVGFGSVAYQHIGPGGAPPATAGIAHVVSNLDITLTSEVFA